MTKQIVKCVFRQRRANHDEVIDAIRKHDLKTSTKPDNKSFKGKTKKQQKKRKSNHILNHPLAFFSLVFRSFDCGNLSIRVRATRGSDLQAITKFTLTEPFLKASLNSFFLLWTAIYLKNKTTFTNKKFP